MMENNLVKKESSWDLLANSLDWKESSWEK